MWPAPRHAENCAHCGSVKTWMITRIIAASSVCFSSLGLVGGQQSFIFIIDSTDNSYLSSSLIHTASSSITLRAPTCSNEPPTPMMGENFKTILVSRYGNPFFPCFLLVPSPNHRIHADPMQSRARTPSTARCPRSDLATLSLLSVCLLSLSGIATVHVDQLLLCRVLNEDQLCLRSLTECGHCVDAANTDGSLYVANSNAHHLDVSLCASSTNLTARIVAPVLIAS